MATWVRRSYTDKNGVRVTVTQKRGLRWLLWQGLIWTFLVGFAMLHPIFIAIVVIMLAIVVWANLLKRKQEREGKR